MIIIDESVVRLKCLEAKFFVHLCCHRCFADESSPTPVVMITLKLANLSHQRASPKVLSLETLDSAFRSAPFPIKKCSKQKKDGKKFRIELRKKDFRFNPHHLHLSRLKTY
jgi:hypothetical protein